MKKWTLTIFTFLFFFAVSKELLCAEQGHFLLEVLIKKRTHCNGHFTAIESKQITCEVQENMTRDAFKIALLAIIQQEFKGRQGRIYCYEVASLPKQLTRAFCKGYGVRYQKNKILISDAREISKAQSAMPLFVFL